MANRKRTVVLIVISLFILSFYYENPKVDNTHYIHDYGLVHSSADTGFLNPSTASNEVLAGSGASWSSVDLSKSQSDSYAEVSVGKGAYSDYLRVVNFGFSLSDSTIDGIEVEIDKYSSNALIQDYDVYLVLSGSTQGDDYAKTGVAWATSDTDTYIVYGGSSDTWNSGLTYSDINDITFGVEISAINTKTGAPATYTAYIDHIRIKIYYTITVEDNDPPTWDTLTESADPLEFGATETININVYDDSTISNVYIEIDAVNNSMGFISGDNYRYSTWTPSSVGIKTYQIHMIDEHGNINQTDDLTITVQDTTNPVINNVIESADPLEFGTTETIDCDITDESDMYFVYLEFDGSNHSMSFVSGINWEYTTWQPISIGIKNYKIWANDTEGNINSYNGDITVQDTTNPVINNVIESADPLTLGNTEIINCDITDESDMYFVYLEFDGSNHSMSFVSGINWEYTTWQPISIGIKNYKIWANDTEENIHFVSGSITVQEESEDSNAPTWDNLRELYIVLELGINQTISINVYDESIISNVYIEINGVNYTMSNVSEVYSYYNWLPLTEGSYVYKIYMIDEHGYISEVSGSFPVQNSPDLLLSVLVLSFLMGLMLFLYLKIRKFELILIVFLFSLVIGGYSLNRLMLPFFPYLQIFFLLFQTIIFYLVSEFEYKNRKRAKYR